MLQHNRTRICCKNSQLGGSQKKTVETAACSSRFIKNTSCRIPRFEDHLKSVDQVFSATQAAGLPLKPSKLQTICPNHPRARNRQYHSLPWLSFVLIRPVPAVIHGPSADLMVEGTEEKCLPIECTRTRYIHNKLRVCAHVTPASYIGCEDKICVR